MSSLAFGVYSSAGAVFVKQAVLPGAHGNLAETIMTSKLWQADDEGEREFLLPFFKHTELDFDNKETRFLVLHPCAGDKAALENHVQCHFEHQFLAKDAPLPFVAVHHARGYRKWWQVVEIDGELLVVSAAMELFLRHFRRSDEPVRLWVRYVCLREFDPAEKVNCWTREYCDALYGKADSLMDMHEFLADLVDKGTVQPVGFEEYDTEKRWSSLPSQHELPSVFPIKLGKKWNHENPTEMYEYIPLDVVTDEIRVLLIEGGADPEVPLMLMLGHTPLHSEVQFYAISYTWSKEDEMIEVHSNGMMLTMKKKLANMLKALRRPGGPCVTWIDAVCIDQTKISERNRQIKRMSEIYWTSDQVICYIGDPNEDSDMALKFIGDLQQPMMEYKDGGWVCGKHDQPKIDPAQIPRLCGALYRLLLRPYFQRVWIIQEIAVASHPYLACGTNITASVEDLGRAIYNLQDMLRRDEDLSDEIIKVTPGLAEISSEVFSYLRTMLYFRHVTSRGTANMEATISLWRPEMRTTTPGYLESAILARKFNATVPSDKLYALWNVARDKSNMEFTMDYTQTTSQAFTSFAVAWSKHTGTLDIIGAAEINAKSENFYADAPSWCPDWSVPSGISCLIRRETIPLEPMFAMKDLDGKLYSADGGVIQESGSTKFFRYEGNTLCCTGIVLDKVSHFVDAGLIFADPRTKFQEYLNALESFYQGGNINPYEDHHRAAWAALFGDSIAAWPKREDNLEAAIEGHEEQYLCRTSLSRHIRYYAGSYRRLDAWDVLGTVMRGREMVITEQGYVALTPGYLRDVEGGMKAVIAILATCSVPALLYEVSEGVYKYLGTCFVQGWMDGEMVTEYMGADTAEEFWLGMEGSKELKIV